VISEDIVYFMGPYVSEAELWAYVRQRLDIVG
jgi:hypothetical protein